MLSYSEQVDRENVIKLRNLCKELPFYCKEFFRGIEPRTRSGTRIAYAYDLKVFFTFLLENNVELKQKFGHIKDLPLEVMEQIQPMDIEEYMEYLKYRNVDKEVLNKERGIKRKLSSLKSFYKYLYRTSMVDNNPTERVLVPKLHDKNIIRLDLDEVVLLLDEVESGENLTEKQKAYHKKTKLRDLTILTLMLGTGIRVSECAGLNMQDVDFKNACIRIHRKGGKEGIVYFGDEVLEILEKYIEFRSLLMSKDGFEDALFLSLQHSRLNVRSIENLVKKYASIVTPLKPITPHKLRSTFGTNLYRETGDIYLVADVLGHKDVNTTKKHYAAIEDDKKRANRNAVRLRRDE